MSTLTSLARARAVETGRAVPIVCRRHAHLSDRPLVFVPLSLAGEANAPLACLVGSRASSPGLLVVPQPRNRDLRFAFAASLASVVLDYVDSFAAATELVDGRNVATDAPQLLVANPSGVAFTRLLGRSTRLRRTEGEYAVEPSVPLLGRWLTYFAERSEYPGSSSMLAMTSVLAAHWATGQSMLEDANLAALIGWIDPRSGLSGPEAAALAEDPVRCPPAGPATDPTFDNEVLVPLVRSYDHAVDDAGRARAAAALGTALHGQLEPTWRLMWQGVSLLRALPAGPSLSKRWLQDRREFTDRMEYWRDGGLPQGRTDQAVAAARRLNRLEREQDEFIADRARDDELAMAEFRLGGEAFAGLVISRDATRLDTSGPRRKLRPHIVVSTSDRLRLEQGVAVRSTSRPGQEARILDISYVESIAEVRLELAGGMGRSLTPAPGSVPELAERLCYSTLGKDAGRPAPFPSVEETPWTHGGPPPVYLPTDEDAAEAWA